MLRSARTASFPSACACTKGLYVRYTFTKSQLFCKFPCISSPATEYKCSVPNHRDSVGKCVVLRRERFDQFDRSSDSLVSFFVVVSCAHVWCLPSRHFLWGLTVTRSVFFFFYFSSVACAPPVCFGRRLDSPPGARSAQPVHIFLFFHGRLYCVVTVSLVLHLNEGKRKPFVTSALTPSLTDTLTSVTTNLSSRNRMLVSLSQQT